MDPAKRAPARASPLTCTDTPDRAPYTDGRSPRLPRHEPAGRTRPANRRPTEWTRTTHYPIAGYALRRWSTGPTTNLSPGTAVAGIYYYQGGQYRGYVYFFPDGTPLAAPIHDATNGRVFLHFNLSQLHAVLDVFRNEK